MKALAQPLDLRGGIFVEGRCLKKLSSRAETAYLPLLNASEACINFNFVSVKSKDLKKIFSLELEA